MNIESRLARLEKSAADNPQAQQATVRWLREAIAALESGAAEPDMPGAVRARMARSPQWPRIKELRAKIAELERSDQAQLGPCCGRLPDH